MFVQKIECHSCGKLIDQERLPLHYMMCSTMQLRKSQILINYSQKMQTCIFCMQQIQQKEFDFHTSLQCKHRLVPCIDCEDMFPLSLFNEHLEVCRVNASHKQQQEIEQEQSSALNNLVVGISSFGSSLFTQAVSYCSKVIQDNKAPALQIIQIARSTITNTVQDILMALAYEQNAEGLPREEIRKIQLLNYEDKNNGSADLCTICYCELIDKQVIKQLKCKHIYHPGCIDRWLRINSKCPVCKTDQRQE